MRTWQLIGITITVIALALAGTGLLVYNARSIPATPAAPPAWAAPAPTVERQLTISYDPMHGAFAYSSAALTVPSHVRIQFTIVNYDPGTAMLMDRSAAQVVGTMGGSMMVGPMMHSTEMQSVPTNDVSHTFTISNGYQHLNVPVLPAASDGAPTSVTFTVEFGTPGTYSWGCVIPCGGTEMSDAAGMYGTITVT